MKKVVYAAAVDAEPKDGDVFDIIILNSDSESTIEGAKGKRDRNLENLHNNISNYLNKHVSDGVLVRFSKYSTRNHSGETAYYPFKVRTPDSYTYPEDPGSNQVRDFKIRVTYEYTSLGDKHNVTLRDTERSSDICTIPISSDRSEFRQAELDAKSFIDGKIKEVFDRYNTDPDSMSDI